MATVDIILLILIILGAIEGYRKGLLRTIMGLVGFVLAIILGVYFMEPMSKYLAKHLDQITFAFPILAFLIVFGITMAIVGIAGWMMKKMVDLVLLGGLDSIGGAILGIVKTAFFISLFLWLANLFDLKMSKEWSAKSEFLQYVEPLAPAVIWVLEPVVPKIGELQKTVDEIVEGFKDAAAD
ncbi:CvpA family protein [Algoriphagus aestuariicola]|uniref:CvpA family protein n=1 Tax=Algoriphagus aestuariicola TaxID=1852016 RepID=A0ABS3BSD6_9BACT|nr:CvpA family protein [Algoriphagus aestuariicola]MBN7802028.1 CvpA family protein [Algoriphagus aestuariicola]